MSDVAVPNRHDTSTGAPGSQAPARLGRAERGLAFALVVLFLVALVAMYQLRDDQYWDRLLFLFGALEALVFAGAGALFGTTVQRGNVEAARKDAAVARQDAQAARQEMTVAREHLSAARDEAAHQREEARVVAERGTRLADTVRVFAAGQPRPRPDRPGARPEDLAPASPPSELGPLVELADRWFPAQMVRLEGERVVLRPLGHDELDAVLAARDRLRMGWRAGGARARERLRRRLGRSGRLLRGHLDLGIEVDGRLIGEIQARTHPAQTLPPGVYELGILVYELGILVYDEADRGSGHGREAVALLTRWLFEQAGAARVQAGTAVANAGMRRVLERLGFACEGVMRAFEPQGPGGARNDFALYAMTADDWAGGSAR